MDILNLGEKFLKHLRKPAKANAAYLAAADLCCDPDRTASAVTPPDGLSDQDRIREVENTLYGIKASGVHERDSVHIPRLLGLALEYMNKHTQTLAEELGDGKASSEPIK